MQGDAVVRNVVAFGRILRSAGLEIGPDRVANALAALDHVDLSRQADVKAALSATFVSHPEELDVFSGAFQMWLLFLAGAPTRQPTAIEEGISLPGAKQLRVVGFTDDEEPGSDAGTGGWSAKEHLRTTDFGTMTEAEIARARELMTTFAAARPLRRSRRMRRSRRGKQIDLRRLARRSLAAGGDPFERPVRDRISVPRRLILLCDVSGSMEAYSRALLLTAHGMVGSGKRVEAFAFGTRLTRLTVDLSDRDSERALAAAARRVFDWSGGTRIGASLKAFNDEWGRRGLTRGAIVIICSDGWERDDTELVGREMSRLHRAAFSVIWVNPLKGSPDYQPLAGGMRAALPHVDRFVAGHDLRSLEALADVVGSIRTRHQKT